MKKKFLSLLIVPAAAVSLAGCDTSGSGTSWFNSWGIWAILAVIIVLFIVWNFFSRKKRKQQVDNLTQGIKPGARVKTVGGLVGTIVEVRTVSPTEKHIVIKSGDPGSETTLVMDINSVGMILRDSGYAQQPVKDEDLMPSDAEADRLLKGGAPSEPVREPSGQGESDGNATASETSSDADGGKPLVEDENK